MKSAATRGRNYRWRGILSSRDDDHDDDSNNNDVDNILDV